MSSLHNENILEDCFEVAMESFRINNKLTHEQLDDYIHYDDADELPENLIGGLSVANRVESIQNKIDLIFKNNNKGAI